MENKYIPTAKEKQVIEYLVANYAFDADDYQNFRYYCVHKGVKPSYELFNYYFTVKDSADQSLEEDIEKHDVLNPKLFNNDETLKEDVREQILKIVNTFLEELEEDNIELLVNDIVLIGSNASYNYTKDSDLDIHILADTSMLTENEALYAALYSAYRSLFNKKFTINFYDIPVELYVETEGVNTISNGIYSVKDDAWIKEPVQEDIPELDAELFEKESSAWIERANDIINDFTNNELLPEEAYEIIVKYIEDIYNLRKTSLAEGGEYSIGNLVFKEVRNLGLLDTLKDLKNEATSRQLSLESLQEILDAKKYDSYLSTVSLLTGYTPTLKNEGYFSIKDVPENKVAELIESLSNSDIVSEVARGASGGYQVDLLNRNTIPVRNYSIIGRFK